MNLNRLFLSTDGRTGRGQFWLGIVVLAAVGMIAGLIIGLAFGPLTLAGQVLVFALQLLLAYPAYSVMAKRFQDRGRGRTYAAVAVGVVLLVSLLTLAGMGQTPSGVNGLGDALSFIELVVVFWILIDLGLRRGTVGPNEFGPDPAGSR